MPAITRSRTLCEARAEIRNIDNLLSSEMIIIPPTQGSDSNLLSPSERILLCMSIVN